MKKVLSLILALTLCLSLCACGNEKNESTDKATTKQDPDTSYSDEIVITTENWQDYLEMKEIVDWSASGSGCAVTFSLGLKDEYADKEVSSMTTLDVEWKGTWVYRQFSCNRDQKTYTIGSIIESRGSEDVQKQTSFHPNLLNLDHMVEKHAVMVVGGATDYTTYLRTIENFEIISATGTIHFK